MTFTCIWTNLITHRKTIIGHFVIFYRQTPKYFTHTILWRFPHTIKTIFFDLKILQDFPEELQGDVSMHLHNEILSLPIFDTATEGCKKLLAIKVIQRLYFYCVYDVIWFKLIFICCYLIVTTTFYRSVLTFVLLTSFCCIKEMQFKIYIIFATDRWRFFNQEWL